MITLTDASLGRMIDGLLVSGDLRSSSAHLWAGYNGSSLRQYFDYTALFGGVEFVLGPLQELRDRYSCLNGGELLDCDGSSRRIEGQ